MIDENKFNVKMSIFSVGLVSGIIVGFIFSWFYISLSAQRYTSNIEIAKEKSCEKLITMGCRGTNTNSIIVNNWDANRNGEINDSGDTLFALCQNWYGVNTDSDCKTKVCNCPP